MRALLALIILALPTWAQLSAVSAVAAGNDSVSSVATAATSHTAGNLLYVVAKFREACGSRTITITNTAGDTFTAIGSLVDNTTNICTGHWYAKNITGHASDVVTMTVSGTAPRLPALSVREVGGADTTSPLITSTTGTTSSTTTVTSSTFSTTGSAIILAGGAFYNGSPITAGAIGGTTATIQSGSTETYGLNTTIEHRIVSTNQSSITAAIDGAGGTIGTILVAAFQEAGGGGPATVPVKRRVIN